MVTVLLHVRLHYMYMSTFKITIFTYIHHSLLSLERDSSLSLPKSRLSCSSSFDGLPYSLELQIMRDIDIEWIGRQRLVSNDMSMYINYLPICLSIYPFVFPSIYSSMYPSIHPSIHSFIHSFAHLFIHSSHSSFILFVYLFRWTSSTKYIKVVSFSSTQFYSCNGFKFLSM